ncbi:MAG: D-allose transport system permease protein AlsC [Spirochaetes bacterium ADurb.Bin110]|jgi:D-allose transport system permease protein|nr:MAG: D-allose transport system permease protein AlsC [Spirochaetes bacterium ADurb.Bin110]
MSSLSSFRSFWQKYGTLVILIFLILLIGILSPKYFLTADNLTQVVLQSSITILIAIGEFFAILIAGIDLSVGSVMAFTGLITAKMLVAHQPIWLAILVGGVGVGLVLGLFNGFLVNATGLHPFIITLGTQSIYRGLTLILSDARPVYGLPPAYMSSIGGWIWRIPVPVIIAILYAAIMSWFTTKSKAGRNLYAIGGNKSAAWYNGILVKRHVSIAFAISGISAGLAGVVMIARLGAAEPLAGVGFETYAIASAIIGGTSFFGGVGRIWGVVIGGLVIGVINNGLNILNVPTFYQQIVMGSLIIISVFLDHLVSSKQ